MRIAEYAAQRGYTARGIQKAIATGRIPSAGRGYVISEIADRALALNTDPAQQRKTPQQPQQRPQPAPAPAAAQQVTNVTAAFGTSRALREQYRAKRERLAFEHEAGMFLKRDVVNKQFQQCAQDIVESLYAMPDRLTGILAAETDPTRIHKILMDEIRHTASKISEQLRSRDYTSDGT